MRPPSPEMDSSATRHPISPPQIPLTTMAAKASTRAVVDGNAESIGACGAGSVTSAKVTGDGRDRHGQVLWSTFPTAAGQNRKVPQMAPLVVLPTYQEAENIRDVLARIRAAVPDAHVLVVDDGSPDGTADLAEASAAELGQIDVLRRAAKSGLGPSYRAGFAWGMDRHHPVLVEMDADLSHDPDVLPRLISAVVEGSADLAIGSRYVPGGAVPGWPAHRRVLSQWGNRYIGYMLKMPVRDATAGFRAYRTTIIEKVGLHTVRADGYGFQIEMAYEVAKSGGTIVEIPITFRNRARGVSKMSPNIISEALVLVTRWGLRDRLRRLRRR